jgi:hypothetical protein
VANHLQLSSDSHKWNVSFIRAAHDWEVDSFSSFFNLLYSIRLRRGMEDKLFGPLPREGCLRSDHSIMPLSLMTMAPSLGKSIWQSKVPLRVAFFAWSAALGKILTMDNLRKQNLIVVDWCCMCKKSGKTIDHLLLHCEVARAL